MPEWAQLACFWIKVDFAYNERTSVRWNTSSGSDMMGLLERREWFMNWKKAIRKNGLHFFVKRSGKTE